MASWMARCLTNGMKRTMRTSLRPIWTRRVCFTVTSQPITPPIVCALVYLLYHTDSGLAHVTCGCKWDISKDDASKGLKNAPALELGRLSWDHQTVKKTRMKDHMKVQLTHQLSAAAEVSPSETSQKTDSPTHRVLRNNKLLLLQSTNFYGVLLWSKGDLNQ